MIFRGNGSEYSYAKEPRSGRVSRVAEARISNPAFLLGNVSQLKFFVRDCEKFHKVLD